MRKTNPLPLVIGADTAGGHQAAVSHFNGLIDAVRLSTVARYEGGAFGVPERLAPDVATLLLLNMDRPLGGWIYDESPRHGHARIHGKPQPLPVHAVR